MANDLHYPAPLAAQFFKSAGRGLSRLFWRLRYEGLENIPPVSEKGYVLAANHQTYIDPVWIAAPIKQKLQFMAFDEAFDWPIVGPLIRYLGSFPVSLAPKGYVSAFRTALRVLNDGAALVIFPEGARAEEDGELLEMKEGTMRIVISAKTFVVPVTIAGGNRVWPRGWSLPKFFRPVTVTYHEPFFPESDDAALETERLREAILN